MSYMNRAANLVAFFEGFIPKAAWDVNAYRLGYGSDTEGPDERRVTRDMTTTEERALENLKVRLPKFEKIIIDQVGSFAYHALSDDTKTALISFTYNYGKLTNTLAETVKRLKPNKDIAYAIRVRGIDNNSINNKRRFAEAAIVYLDRDH